MTMHQPIARDAGPPPAILIGEIALVPVRKGGWSPRRRMAVIALASAWLWVGIATIGHLALG